jgi:uncharacterized membrane protein YdjX (TVP38/TMEM64 family)
MLSRLPSLAGFLLGGAVAAGVYFLIESRGLAAGLGLVVGYLAWAELSDLVAGPAMRATKAPAGTPLLQNPVIRRRLFGLLLIGGASSIILTELLIGDVAAEEIRERVQAYGALGPIILMTVIAVAMIIAPIPNTPWVIAAGIVWGTFWGVVYVIGGQLIGSTVIFFISRRFGRKFIPRLVGQDAAARIDRLSRTMGPQVVFWWRMMPVSFDFGAYAAGLTAMRYRVFITLVFLGSIIPTTVIVSFGDSFTRSWTARFISLGLVALAITVPVTIFYLRNRATLPPPGRLIRNVLGGASAESTPESATTGSAASD